MIFEDEELLVVVKPPDLRRAPARSAQQRTHARMLDVRAPHTSFPLTFHPPPPRAVCTRCTALRAARC